MITDMHIHIASLNQRNGSFVSEKFKKSLTASHFYKSLGLTKSDIFTKDPEDLDNLIIEKFLALIDQSKIDHVMLLGLDAAYTKDGIIDQKNTKMITSENFLQTVKEKSKSIIIAPSIHPYRKDALSKLEELRSRGVKIIKWIPAAQNIEPDSHLCIPFYEKIKELNMAIITHTCIEHAVVSFSQDLNHMRRLELPLSLGVNIIAAHCATNLFIYERSQYPIWKKFIHKYDNLYGDISAFNVPTRIKYLKDIRESDELKSRVFYGSDFPIKSLPISFLFHIGIKNYKEMKKIKNPLDLSYELAYSFFKDERIFSNFNNFLNSLDN